MKLWMGFLIEWPQDHIEIIINVAVSFSENSWYHYNRAIWLGAKDQAILAFIVKLKIETPPLSYDSMSRSRRQIQALLAQKAKAEQNAYQQVQFESRLKWRMTNLSMIPLMATC